MGASVKGEIGDVLVVVPARGGSKGVPGKNLRTVGGVSLVGRAVIRGREFVLRAGLGDRARVVVDTDAEAIAEEGRRWGGEVPFLRPSELARDDTSTAASLRHLLGRLDHREGSVVLLQPTSPLCRGTDVLACWRAFRDAGAASVVSVVPPGRPPGLALSMDAAGVVDWALGSAPVETRRQAHAVTWWPSGAVYIVDTARFLDTGAFIRAGETLGVPLEPARSLDVDDPADLAVARAVALRPTEPDSPGSGEEPGIAWDDAAAVIDAGPTIGATIEAILRRMGGADAPRGVRVRSGPEAGWSRVSQISAVRSIFGLPVGWEFGGGERAEDVAAIIVGAEPIGGREAVPWLDDVERLVKAEGR